MRSSCGIPIGSRTWRTSCRSRNGSRRTAMVSSRSTSCCRPTRARRRADHDADRAVEVTRSLLDEELSPAWRMLVLRDYVWMAIQLKEVDSRILDDVRQRLDKALTSGTATSSVFLPLLVEQARVFAALGRFENARGAMKRYFREVDKKRIRFREQRSADPLLVRAPPRTYRPCSTSKPACCTDSCYKTSRTGRTPKSIGAPVTARPIPPDPVRIMKRRSLAHSAARSPQKTPTTWWFTPSRTPTPAARTSAAPALRLRPPSCKEIITAILNRAWTSSRGRREAEDIVFRRTSFRRFTSVQIRLWLFEGFKMALAGRDGVEGSLSNKEEDFLWELTRPTPRRLHNG